MRNNARFPFSFAMQAASVNKANEGVSSSTLPNRQAYMTYDDALMPLSLGVRDCGTPRDFLAWVLPTTTWRTSTHADPTSLDDQDFCSRNHAVKQAESRMYTFLVDEVQAKRAQQKRAHLVPKRQCSAASRGGPVMFRRRAGIWSWAEGRLVGDASVHVARRRPRHDDS